MKRNRSYNGKDDTTEHECWTLFWDYEALNMLRRQFNPKAKKSVPKDPFELATYKICELKLNTERFSSYYSKEYVTEFINVPLEERAKNGQH